MNNLASDAQRRKFFAMVHYLGIDTDTAKVRAKKKFTLTSFSQISSPQINELIKALQLKLAQKPHQHNFVCKKCNTALELVFILPKKE